MIQTAKRAGRRKNEWGRTSLGQMLDFINNSEITQKTFSEYLGVTNSTFHNWKKGKCAPTEALQDKIVSLINNKENLNMSTNGNGTAVAKRGRISRGSGSSTLAALTGALPAKKSVTKNGAASKKTTAKKVTKKAVKTVKKPAAKTLATKKPKKKDTPLAKKKRTYTRRKVAGATPAKRVGRVVNKSARSNSNSSLEGWARTSDLGSFLSANSGRTSSEIASLVNLIREAADLLS